MMVRNKHNYKISVIIPVYNVEKYLKQCLDSVINQSYKNLEIIIVDDWSTDNSWKICDEYAEKDKRIKLIHQKNNGLSAARNTWLKIATGEYVWYIDSDDFVELDMYEKLYDSIVSTKSELAICNRYIGKNDGNRIQNTKFPDREIITSDTALQYFYDSMYVWNKLYKRDIINDLDFVETRGQDVIYNFKIFKRIKKIVCLKECKIFYRYNPISRSHSNRFRRNWLLLIKDWLNKEIEYANEKNLVLLKKSLVKSKVCYAVYRLSLLALDNSTDIDSIKFLQKIVKENLFIYLKTKRSLIKKCFSVFVCVNFRFSSTIYRFINNCFL